MANPPLRIQCDENLTEVLSGCQLKAFQSTGI
jgi:hypothetical protein